MSSDVAGLFDNARDGIQRSAALTKEIDGRLSQELIFALVGPIGSGVSTAAKHIASVLSDEFGYKIFDIIKPSDIIKKESVRVSISVPDKKDLANYVQTMQDAGNKLREKFGTNYLAEKIIEKIAMFRQNDGGYKNVDRRKIMIPARRAFIIDSLKNNEEIDLLKKVYGNIVVLVGVFAPDEIRSERLIHSGIPKEIVQNIISRDQNEVATFGQKTRKIFVNSYFFICNDQTEKEIRSSISRYLELIFDVGIRTPRRAEAVMYEAAASASKSACMSRQVGASIVSSEGELISVGWNDVPKFGGGLYDEDDGAVWDDDEKKVFDKDNRCWKWKTKICHNETRRNSIIDNIIDQIKRSKIIKKNTTENQIREIISGNGVDSLTEFSRSIHAEMAAILAVAREGRHSLVGSTMYVNTYPCHNCARHIVASGIRHVVYIQPYKKSLALDLHGDAITENPFTKGKVLFRQYEGVAPSMFLSVFNPARDRKRDGKYDPQSPKVALPVMRVPLDGASEYEAKVIADLASREQTATDGQ